MVTNREGDAAADTGCRRVGDSFDQKQPSRSACSVEERPSSSAVCSSAPRSLHLSGHAAAKPSAAQAASLCGGSDDSDVEDMDEDDGCMSDPDSGDSDLTERITGLEVRLARRSAEVQMLKAAVAAVQAHARPPSPPAAPEPPQPPAPPCLPAAADTAGQFVVSLDGRVVLSCGPYAGKPLSQVATLDRAYLQHYMYVPMPAAMPPPLSNHSQLLAAVALRNCLPVRCR